MNPYLTLSGVLSASTRSKTTLGSVGKTITASGKSVAKTTSDVASSVAKTTKKIVKRTGEALEPVSKALGIRDRTIVIVHKPAHRLFVRQPVFVVVEATGARWGRIQSLQVDEIDVGEVLPNVSAPTGIGIGLDFRFPQNLGAKLVALPNDDELVWSAAES